MISIVRETITRYSMLRPGDRVAVGLSGGADSVSLLSALLELAPELELTISAIHINHGIRGQSADRDQRFCEEFCASKGVKLDCFTLDIPALAAEKGVGLEQCGRECRYQCFEQIARRDGCKIATAHTLSDSAETVLFNLARGSGLGGVCGIPPVRGNIIRPLIAVTRNQIEEHCKVNSLDYVTDETNTDTIYRRNLIRSEVIPALEQVNPAMHRAVERFTRCAREDNLYLEQLCEEALEKAAADGGWRAEALAALPPALQKRAVMSILARQDTTPEYAQVERCIELIRAGSGALVIRNGVRFVVNKGIVFTDSGTAELSRPEQWSVAAELPSTLLPDGRIMTFTQIDLSVPGATQKNHNLLFKKALSCDIINSNTQIRNRREGDRFAPAGRGVNRLLKKFLCDEGVPAEKRGQLAIIASDQGILWVEGFGSSELGRPDDGDSVVIIPHID